MNKIQTVSRWLRRFFLLVFWTTPIIVVAFWLTAPFSKLVLLNAPIALSTHSVAIMQLPVGMRMLGLLASIVPTAIFMLIVHFLVKLFRLYSQGHIFSLTNVRCIRNIAITMLIGQLIAPFYEAMMSVILTMNLGPGHRVISVTFGTPNIKAIVTALVILLVSWIMEEGRKIQEEQSLTV